MGDEGGAEAVLNLPLNSSIPISYHPSFGPHDDLLLLEVEPTFLPHFLHNQVSIRGHPDDDAVLCTPSSTYALKSVSTSNNLFLIPPTTQNTHNDPNTHNEPAPAATPTSVLKIAPGHMELVHIAPRLDKLKSLLAKNPYQPDFDEADRTGLYTWSDLAGRIQASDEELRSGLQAVSAVEIDGYWRIVDDELMAEVFTMMLHDSVLNDWSLKSLKGDEVVPALEKDGFPPAIVIHCLEMFGTESEGVWSLDERRVCLHFAKRILRKGKRKMESFMEEWEQSIPSGMRACFEMLEGEVLLERMGIETWVRQFSISALPSDPAERFAALFRERQKWEWKDLEPYIRDLWVPGLTSEGLLIKYTRRTQPTADAEPIFTAR
ncbi:uncharacterized protein LOC131243711 [Magnolia sinica]|uniref:uncharacterized protein LOC131243711 n=1 Tax=Magnolia sinica TaxID=86752 RepID=UPI002657B54C|nr:uncharacterized protein LOC131243711 [Magnolia sinica]